MDPKNRLTSFLQSFGQEHLLGFWGELSQGERERLQDDIDEINFEEVSTFYKQATESADTQAKLDGLLKPIPADIQGSVSSTNEDVLASYEEEGLRQIAEGRVGVLLLAGGQGTRLGVSYPKGMYDVGLPSHKPLFQVQAERILKLQSLAKMRFSKNCSIMWFIMTSDATMENTQTFLEKHNYFGLESSNIVLFEQGMLPCFTNDGKIILDQKNRISKSPDGNGGIYRALREQKILRLMQEKGVKYLHAHSVDNILVKVADPTFIGYCVKRGADCAAKVVEKTSPTEAVGVVCDVAGKYQVVEYSEITSKTAERKNADGRLTFSAGSICNHFFTVDFLRNIANEYESKLKVHVARKKIAYINENGIRVTPDAVNGLKFEKFIFDVFPFSSNFVTWEVPREHEFSALKNNDSADKDTPSTARADIYRLHRSYIQAAGGVVNGNGPCEISPLVSYAGEGLKVLCEGKVFDTPVHLMSPEETSENGFH